MSQYAPDDVVANQLPAPTQLQVITESIRDCLALAKSSRLIRTLSHLHGLLRPLITLVSAMVIWSENVRGAGLSERLTRLLSHQKLIANPYKAACAFARCCNLWIRDFVTSCKCRFDLRAVTKTLTSQLTTRVTARFASGIHKCTRSRLVFARCLLPSPTTGSPSSSRSHSTRPVSCTPGLSGGYSYCDLGLFWMARSRLSISRLRFDRGDGVL